MCLDGVSYGLSDIVEPLFVPGCDSLDWRYVDREEEYDLCCCSELYCCHVGAVARDLTMG